MGQRAENFKQALRAEADVASVDLFVMETCVPGIRPDTPCFEAKIPMGKGYGYMRVPDAAHMNREQREYVVRFLDLAKEALEMQVFINTSEGGCLFVGPLRHYDGRR